MNARSRMSARLILTLVLVGGLLVVPVVSASAEPDFGICGDGTETPIHVIQGTGFVSPEVGVTHVIEGVVVGDFETSSGLLGFYVQEEDADTDNDKDTSEGIFVFNGGSGDDVDEGDVVRVKGTVGESSRQTQIGSLMDLEVCPNGAEASSSKITLPLPPGGDFERVEGMLIHLSQRLVATDNFSWGRFGEVGLSLNHRLENPTNAVPPGSAANSKNERNDRSRILLDDGSGVQNPTPLPPYVGPGNTIRAGDTVRGISGVMGEGFGSYRIQPTEEVAFTRENTRPDAAPDVGGDLRVGAFNVLNYFTTIDTGADICGPSFDQGCRGADSLFEFGRQRAKLVSAITQLDADVLGVTEIENNFDNSPINDLVSGLNAFAGAGTYSAIQTAAIGEDAIRVGLIYQPGNATPVGNFAILDNSVDPRFNDDKNRPVLAQTFEADGERFTVAVNHLKSKGSPCDDVGDPDTGDQQGNCNGTRTDAAEALADWLGTDPTGSGDPDFLIIGDLNAYPREDPVNVLLDSGYTDLVRRYNGPNEYSFVFRGEAGYLDHALANKPMRKQVTGAAVWHINADEPSALDYNDFNQTALYNPDQYRSSDHDPVIVGLNLK